MSRPFKIETEGRTVSFVFPGNLTRAAKQRALFENTSFSDVVRRAVTAYLAAHD